MEMINCGKLSYIASIPLVLITFLLVLLLTPPFSTEGVTSITRTFKFGYRWVFGDGAKILNDVLLFIS